MTAIDKDLQRLWGECFDNSPQWTDTFFPRLYRDEESLVLRPTADSPVASALLLKQFDFKFHDARVQVGYLCAAATRRRQRGKGYMHILVREALREAHHRGHLFAALIPAHGFLYPFFQQFGFRSVLCVHEDRYTSLHPFNTTGEYSPVDDPYTDEAFDAFARLEQALPCRVLHSHRDYLNFLDDNSFYGGYTAMVCNACGEICGMAWGRPVDNDDCLIVSDVLGDNDDSCTAALRVLRYRFGEIPFKVLSRARTMGAGLSSRGMMRVVNVEPTLQTIAAAHPKWRCSLQITDPLIAHNNGIFDIEHGRVTRTAQRHPGTLPLDIDTFTAAIFSDPRIGAIMDIPSQRPHMPLMVL